MGVSEVLQRHRAKRGKRARIVEHQELATNPRRWRLDEPLQQSVGGGFLV